MQVRRIAGLDKHKLELKYDTFSQVSAIDQEARFGKYYKFKSSINSFSVCLMLSIKNCELLAAKMLGAPSTFHLWSYQICAFLGMVNIPLFLLLLHCSFAICDSHDYLFKACSKSTAKAPKCCPQYHESDRISDTAFPKHFIPCPRASILILTAAFSYSSPGFIGNTSGVESSPSHLLAQTFRLLCRWPHVHLGDLCDTGIAAALIPAHHVSMLKLEVKIASTWMHAQSVDLSIAHFWPLSALICCGCGCIVHAHAARGVISQALSWH